MLVGIMIYRAASIMLPAFLMWSLQCIIIVEIQNDPLPLSPFFPSSPRLPLGPGTPLSPGSPASPVEKCKIHMSDSELNKITDQKKPSWR